MRRRAAATLLFLSVAAFVGGSSRAASPGCAAAEVRIHDEAVFGHFSTHLAASTLAKRAGKLGFDGIKIENEGCGDFEVEIDGADREADRVSFAKEAARAGFQVTFEQIADPIAYQTGQVVGVFAKLTTLAAANALSQRLATVNFRYIDLVRVGTRWWVVMPQVPIKNALSIVHEAAGAGFHLVFQPGRK